MLHRGECEQVRLLGSESVTELYRQDFPTSVYLQITEYGEHDLNDDPNDEI